MPQRQPDCSSTAIRKATLTEVGRSPHLSPTRQLLNDYYGHQVFGVGSGPTRGHDWVCPARLGFTFALRKDLNERSAHPREVGVHPA